MLFLNLWLSFANEEEVDNEAGQSSRIGENKTIFAEGESGKCVFGKMRDFHVEF